MSDVVARNIRQLRALEGWSQERLAEKLGCTRSAVSYYESGRIYPKMAMLEKMAALFGVSVADLVYDEPVYDIGFGGGRVTEDEYNLLRYFRAMSPRFRSDLLSLARSMAESGAAKNNRVSEAV